MRLKDLDCHLIHLLIDAKQRKSGNKFEIMPFGQINAIPQCHSSNLLSMTARGD